MEIGTAINTERVTLAPKSGNDALEFNLKECALVTVRGNDWRVRVRALHFATEREKSRAVARVRVRVRK